MPPTLTNPMAKLVVLSEGFNGRAYELKEEKFTVGRVDDNSIALEEPSVSSHHCEITLKGEELHFQDLNSTNGSFLEGEPFKVGIVKHGQILRLGQLELRFEVSGKPVPAAKPGASPKRALDPHAGPSQGVKLNELDKTGRPVSLDPTSPFKKQSNSINKVFIAIGIVLGLVFIGLILMALQKLNE